MDNQVLFHNDQWSYLIKCPDLLVFFIYFLKSNSKIKFYNLKKGPWNKSKDLFSS